MQKRTIIAGLGIAAMLVVAGTSGAVAGSLITGKDVKNESLTGADIKNGSIRKHDFSSHVNALLKSKGTVTYQGAHWSPVYRNTVGNGDVDLQAGPMEAPYGVGSLMIRTGSNTDQATFGNELDFVDHPLSSITTVEYSVFTTGENIKRYAANLPNVSFEVNPHTARTYSTLTFMPSAVAEGWSRIDASTAAGWYYTGGAGADSGIDISHPATLADAKAAFPDATIGSVQIGKGRDFAFAGAVDGLQLNNDLYDFEPFGVKKTTVS